MDKVKLHFRNKEVELESDNSAQLKELAAKYNSRLANFGSPLKVSDIKVALVAGIKMEYEIEQLRSKLQELEGAGTTKTHENGELAQTLEHIALYLNSISEKLEGAA